MMVFSEIDLSQIDESDGVIIYGKLFSKILEDFITREDAKQMMQTSNLPVTTSVDTLVNTAVQVVPASGTGTGIGKGTGTGKGNTSPIYNGSQPSAGSRLLEQRRKAEKERGYVEIKAQTAPIEQTSGL
jgi:hypothetical protein